MSKRAALIAAGAILTLGGAALAVTGGAVVAAIGTDGTFSSRGTVTSTAAALVSERGVIEDRGAGALGRPSVEIGVTDSVKPVFVGVGPARDVDRYLAGAAVETVTDFDVAPLHLTGSVREGSRQLDAPGDQDFWVERSEGSKRGRHELEAARWRVPRRHHERGRVRRHRGGWPVRSAHPGRRRDRRRRTGRWPRRNGHRRDLAGPRASHGGTCSTGGRVGPLRDRGRLTCRGQASRKSGSSSRAQSGLERHDSPIRKPGYPVLPVLALTLVILLIAYLVRLARTVQENRPASRRAHICTSSSRTRRASPGVRPPPGR